MPCSELENRLDRERSPKCGPLDAIVRPLAISPCTSDVHTVWEGAIGERHDMILGHEAVGEVVEVGSLVKDIKLGDKVIVPAITPDWGNWNHRLDIRCIPAECWQAGNSLTLKMESLVNISM